MTTKKGEDLGWFWEGLDHYLARNQLKQTKQRKVIVDHFLVMHDHLDAEELYEAVRKKGFNIGLATVYRTLNLLKDAGLVEQNAFSDGRAVYELLRPGTHHDHLICVSCGLVVEFENPEIEAMQKKVANEKDFQLISHRLDMYGKCGPCRAAPPPL